MMMLTNDDNVDENVDDNDNDNDDDDNYKIISLSQM